MKWFVGALALLVFGMVFQLGLLVYSMYVLLAVLLLSRYLARQWVENLDAERDCNRYSVQIGETIAIALTLRNRSAIPVPWIVLEDSISKDALLSQPRRLRTTGPRVKVTRLPGHGQQTLLYQVHPEMRGYYQIGPVLLETGDPFGLHRRFKVVSEPNFVLVYPKVVPLEGYNLTTRRPMGEIRLTHRLFEDPTRISGVRPYQHGDAMNRVHWMATARTGAIHCKTFEASCIMGATILMDFHQESYALMNDSDYTSELAVTTAASLANAVYQTGQQIGFMTNARNAADRIKEEGWKHEFLTRDAARNELSETVESDRLRPVIVETRRGADQFLRILESLARAELTDGLTFPQLIDEISSSLTRDATVIAIIRDAPMEHAIALGSLRRRGYSVTAIVILSEHENLPDWAVPPEWATRLLAEGIEFRHVSEELEIAQICAEQLMV
jgi:uncharacterized protein (DUF58 family)